MSEERVPYGNGKTRADTDWQAQRRPDEDRCRKMLCWIMGYAKAAAKAPRGVVSNVTSLKEDLALIAAKCELALNGGEPEGADAARAETIAREPNPLLGDVKFREVSGGGE